MTCHDLQLRLSLYLYGELDFAQEEALERHLADCAFCRQALEREKAWHTSLNSGQRDVPLELLSQCRQGLRAALPKERSIPKPSPWARWSAALRWPEALAISPSRWSYQLAVSSFLVFLGFGAARFLDRHTLPAGAVGGVLDAGLVSPTTRIRDIHPDPQGRVCIRYDQIAQREIVGSPEQEPVRGLLLAGIRNSLDPSLRVDSLDMLSGLDGTDVRDALLGSVQHDSSAAVRLKALESLRRFSTDPETRVVLKAVLAHDSDPRVRSAAIDVFAPANERVQLNRDVEPLLRSLAHSEQDDYLRARCLQLLRQMSAPSDVY